MVGITWICSMMLLSSIWAGACAAASSADPDVALLSYLCPPHPLKQMQTLMSAFRKGLGQQLSSHYTGPLASSTQLVTALLSYLCPPHPLRVCSSYQPTCSCMSSRSADPIDQIKASRQCATNLLTASRSHSAKLQHMLDLFARQPAYEAGAGFDSLLISPGG